MTVFLDVSLVVLAVALLATIVRAVIGPSDADRAVAADLAFFVFVAAVALLGVRLEAPYLFDVAVVATLVGFLASVTFARLLHRKDT
ncbi:monovalent cation/H+ antiporter complex subunit F [Trujillonella humicola]|uniref:monovalent cation/H+ antiporter complex subunit F n=1 Tax=Trujillonella humicola TaxID=3383699 RepID=UPI003905D068